MGGTMKEKVIETAGKVWKALREKDEINISRLPRIIKEKSEIAYQSLGWLAREDKINYQTKNGKCFVSLTDFERNIELPENESIKKKK